MVNKTTFPPVAIPSTCQKVTRYMEEHEVFLEQHMDISVQQLSRGHYQGQINEASLGMVYLCYERYNQAFLLTAHSPDDVIGFTFFWPLGIPGHAVWSNSPVDDRTLMVTGGNEEIDFTASSPPIDIVSLMIGKAALQEYALNVEGIDILSLLENVQAVQFKSITQTQELSHMLLMALQKVQSTPNLLEHSQWLRDLEERVLSKMITSLASTNAASAPPVVHVTTRSRVIKRAMEYMRAHIDEPATIADTCRAIGVSRRTLQYCFQEVLGLNPLALLGALRLNGVMRELRSPMRRCKTIGDIAARWGFWHLSQFAADYKRMFGELPSETKRIAVRKIYTSC